MKLRLFHSTVLALFISNSVLAIDTANGPVSYNGYSRDAGSEFVIGGGLEWYRWDLTINEYYVVDPTEEEANFENHWIPEGEGWRSATTQEMVDLVSNFDLGFDFDSPPYTTQHVTSPYDPEEGSGYQQLVELFGYTEQPNDYEEDVTGAVWLSENKTHESSIFIVDDVLWNVGDEYGNDLFIEQDAYARFVVDVNPVRQTSSGSTYFRSYAGQGIALVRSIEADPVPELSAKGSIIVLGLLMSLLALYRERLQPKSYQLMS